MSTSPQSGHVTTSVPKPPRLGQGDPRREYVAGGSLYWTQDFYRSLPFYIDDLTQDFGDDIYERMLLDPQVAKCINHLKLAALAQGIHLAPAVDEEDPRYELAQEITDFCRRNLAGLEIPFDPAKTPVPLYWQLWDLMDAIALGNKIAEQVYHVPQRGPDAGKLCLKALKVKPRRAVALVVDSFLNVIGILGLIPGQGATTLCLTSIADPEQVPNLLPRTKFAIFSFRPKDGDPRGTTLLRPAYNPWWLKQQTYPEFLKYLAQFGTPSVWGETASDAQESVATNPETGEVLYDELGNPVYQRPEEAMLAGLIGFRNGSAMAVRKGAAIHVVEAQGNGEAFHKAFSFFNREIATAVLGQTLATEEAEHQARASSDTHQDTLDMHVGHVKGATATVIRADVLVPLVEYNYGPEALDLVPKVLLERTEPQDFAPNATAVAGLEKSGYLHPSQYRELDAKLGLPPRSDEAIEEALEARKRAAAAPSPRNPNPNTEEDEEPSPNPPPTPPGKGKP